MGLFGALNAMGSLSATRSIPATAATAHLPAYPLAVKSPYLSTWVPGRQVLSNAATSQPMFWNGIPLTWPVLARVDGETYSLFGLPSGAANITEATTNSVSYTSSHTYVRLTAGSANVVLDFFSPVLPGADEYAKQSLPYSYLTVSASSTNQSPPDVQVMSGIDYSWTSQKGASGLNYTTTDSAGFFQFYNPNQIRFTEQRDMATYGSVLFAASEAGNMTHGCGAAADLLAAFSATGALERRARRQCNATDLASLTKNLGTIGHTASSATFVVGFDRVYAINYLNEPQTGFYRTKWPTIPEAIDYVLSSYQSFLSGSLSFDAAVKTKAERVSRSFGCKYADIVEASVRQTFGGMELTVPLHDMSASEPVAFLKEISSDGNVNTVDFIFQSWPIFISLNPDYIRMLFEPILSYLDAGRFPHLYTIHDIGTHYPNATGHDDGREEHMPMFETSSLFILLYAYQKLSGDTNYAASYSSLLKGYADWMVQPRSLYPGRQLISVDVIRPSANQTGLAVQAAIGLKAAAKLLHNSTYSKVAADNVNALYHGGLGLDGSSPADSEHFTYNYERNKTWNVLFPSYSDVVLDLRTFPQEAWDMQSDWYLKKMKSSGLAFAGPSDDKHYTRNGIHWALCDWNIVAASVSSEAVQEAVINTTHAFLTNGQNSIPFGTKYIVDGPREGLWVGNQNRASVGSHFALMALKEGTWYGK
ncbi:uncharacterized protein LTR77_002514 [Saxophila tyrrhenica]|uniref:Glutaminase n=1 Tax=Saxophila tyrrhenica TaxID=1690608 RepID=A0AAV9PMC5_9PEZI|nr:hypothetical protein LTR77_002514 [Saxophila tyrrhenica]